MRETDFALLVTGFFALALCLAITWLFSDRELRFSGDEHVDPSVRKQLGTFVLVIAGLTLIVPLLVFNAQSLRHWIGAVCLVLASLVIFGSRPLRRSFEEKWEHDWSTGAREAADFESTRSNLSRKIFVRFLIRLNQIALTVLYYYYAGSRYFSLLDLLGFICLLMSFDVLFFLVMMRRKRRYKTGKDAIAQRPSE
jgi:hypothetical protein